MSEIKTIDELIGYFRKAHCSFPCSMAYKYALEKAKELKANMPTWRSRMTEPVDELIHQLRLSCELTKDTFYVWNIDRNKVYRKMLAKAEEIKSDMEKLDD